MRQSRRLIVASAVCLTSMLGFVVAPISIQAAPDGGTAATFEIVAGALEVTVSGTTVLTGAKPGASSTDQLGPVTVTDTRAAKDASWTAVASTTTFVTGGATTAETVPVAAVKYWSGQATATTGTGIFTPGQATVTNATGIAAVDHRTVYSHPVGTGNNSATWNPTIIIDVPSGAVAGDYAGKVTTSVA